MPRKQLLLLLFLFTSQIRCMQDSAPEVSMQLEPVESDSIWTDRIKKGTSTVIDTAVTLTYDVVNVHKNLFSHDSLKILAVFTPVYLLTSIFDTKIHKQFYDADNHKNINQMDDGIASAIRSAAYPMAMVFSSLTILGPTPELRETSKIFTIGYWSGIAAKNLIKKLHFSPALRPWNEKFSADTQSYGGFPSGHMFEASYMTMVYGLQYGWWALLPLSAYTASLFAASVVSNRHYTSQAVAGLALGTIYGLAAHKVIEKNLSDRFSLDFGTNLKGDPALTFTYQF